MAVTIKDVARLAGVDASTVSLALNDDPRVRRATKERILAAAAQLGYRRNRLARGLRAAQTATIGVVLAGEPSPFYGDLILGIESAMPDAYQTVFAYSGQSWRREIAYLEAMRDRQVDGLLIAPSGAHPGYYAQLDRQGVPLVLIDNRVPGVEADAVLTDNGPAAEEATEHLIFQGHTRIAYVDLVTVGAWSSLTERRAGYLAAMERHGLRPSLLSGSVPGRDPMAQGHEAVAAYLRETGGATAFFAASDEVALGALRALSEAGRQVPGDTALVGFSGLRFSEFLVPSLTTMAQDGQEMGRRACQRLLQRIATRPETLGPETIQLPARLVVRASSVGTRPG